MDGDRRTSEIVEEPRSNGTIATVKRRSPPTLVVIDAACRVLFGSFDPAHVGRDAAPVTVRGNLREDVLNIVRELVQQCDGTADRNAMAYLDSARFARVVALDGPGGRNYALTIEHYRGHNSIERAARRFALTRRETQVLTFILEGASAPEIAAAMHIAETTVQGYHKRLLSKTRSRNRASMVATVCDWEGASTQRGEFRVR